jgi:hypothetical protein
VSLIDEALKRAQAAEAGDKRPEAGTRPWTPAPLPDRGRIRRRKAIRAASLVVFVTLASLGAVMLLRRAPDKAPVVLPAPTALPSLPPAEGLPSAANPTEPRPTHAPPVSVATPAANPATPVSPPRSPGAPAPAAAPPGRSVALVDGKIYVGSVTLPGGARIELGGIVYSESNATALVNGKIAGTGAYVEGFTLVRIEESRVELSNGAGLTIFLVLK